MEEKIIDGMTVRDGVLISYDPKGKVDELVIPQGVEAIGDGAFAMPDYLTACKFKADRIVLPEGVRSIGADAFSGNLAECVVIPSTVERIGARAFFQSGIRRIELPVGLKRIEQSLFAYSWLEEIVIPPNVEAIEANAFESCKVLEKAFIPKSVKTIDKWAFFNCTYEGENRLKLYVEGKPQEGWEEKIETVKVRESIVTPEDDAFNFHRSSGSFTSHEVEREVEVVTAWYTDGHNHKFDVIYGKP